MLTLNKLKRKKEYDNYRRMKKKEEIKQKAHMAKIVKKRKRKWNMIRIDT